MTEKPIVDRYPLALRILHWLMALCLLGMIGVGWYMTDVPKDDALLPTIYALHKSFGVLILILLAVRLAVRFTQPLPPLPDISSKTEKRMAHAMHFTLYLLMAAVPLCGIVMSNSYGFAVPFFNKELPKIMGVDIERAKLAAEIHEILAYVLLGLILAHAGAAMKYVFINKYNILKRIL